jgi:hypothetical protein
LRHGPRSARALPAVTQHDFQATFPTHKFAWIEVNDEKLWVASMSGARLGALTKDPAWLSHARYFHAVFAREDSNNLSKVREFSKEYLIEKHDTMLYMFSGPDFLYANTYRLWAVAANSGAYEQR